jgi:osmotically-inducible protein OsmY
MKQFILLSLLICLSLQVACTRGTQSTQAAREERALTDTDLKNEIQAKINSDAQLRDSNLSVAADADRNSATLSGTVESEALRTKAVQMAKAAHPGLNVDDQIQVQPREMTRSQYTAEQARQEVERAKANKETVGSSIDDAWIHTKIVAKMLTDMKTPERKINVDVDKNVVTLRGTVDTAQQKQEAERIAKETDGVKLVKNQLRVGKAETTSKNY